MIARFGNLIYWLGCAAGALFLIGAAAVAVIPSTNPNDKPAVPLFLAAVALIAFLIGRAGRYVFAGR
jgi:phosphotransferase system  glucose/maltose/N-acetylglucosamine-specific IIC component